MPTYLSIYRSICLSVCLCLSVYLSVSLKTQQFCETSSVFELDNIKNETILRDFLNSWTWQHQNETILRDFLNFRSWQHQKWNNSARLPSTMEIDGLVPMRFAICPPHLSKVLRLPRKIDARSYEVLHLSRKIILAKLKIWCSKMQPLSGNQHPHLLTSLMNMSLVLRLPRKMHLCRSSSNVPGLPPFLEMLQNPHVLLIFDKVHNPLRLPRGTRSERPRVVRTWCALYILTLKCSSRHNGVQFFDISTSRSGPNMRCFVHFDLEMCFAPQRRALFRHLNFQKCSKCAVFLAFSLANVLRATTVQFFIYHLASWLRARRFSEPPPEPQIIGKTQFFATFLPFRAPGFSFFGDFLFLIFFLILLSSLTLPISAFHLSILSEVWLPNFLRPIVINIVIAVIITSHQP